MLKNWGGNLEYQSSTVLSPSTVDELSEIIKNGQVRPIGTMHSFSRVVVGQGPLISSAGLPFEPTLNQTRTEVTVGAGCRFGDLAVFLQDNQLALFNMGSLPHISIAGAAATGTHGSGDGNRILSAALVAYSFLNASGELVSYSKDHPNFEACRVGLGAYGLWVSITLAVIPTFQVRQDTYKEIPWDVFYADPRTLTGAGYSVSIFSKWGGEVMEQVWVKSTQLESAGGKLAGISAEPKSSRELAPGVVDNLTEQGGKPGPWLDRLPHFRFDSEPSSGDEIQTEFFFTRDQIVGAVQALHEISAQINPTLIISEIRTIAQDDAWLSPMLRGDSVGIHFTWLKDVPGVDRAVALVEEATAKFHPIPHWGKVHHFNAQRLRKVHPKLDAAREIFDSLDPKQSFNTEYLKSLGVRS